MAEHWRVICIPRRYEWLKTDDGFACLVALGRCLNQIRFSAYVLEAGNEGGHSQPFSARQGTSAVLTLAASLYEGVYLAKNHIGRYFKANENFPAVAAFWRDKDKRDFFDNRVLPLRHRAVSHFDPSETKRQLQSITFTEGCVFAEGVDDLSKDLHYSLSDGIAVMTFAGEHDSFPELKATSNELLRSLAKYAGEFLLASDALIGAALGAYGFVSEEMHLGSVRGAN